YTLRLRLFGAGLRPLRDSARADEDHQCEATILPGVLRAQCGGGRLRAAIPGRASADHRRTCANSRPIATLSEQGDRLPGELLRRYRDRRRRDVQSPEALRRLGRFGWL